VYVLVLVNAPAPAPVHVSEHEHEHARSSYFASTRPFGILAATPAATAITTAGFVAVQAFPAAIIGLFNRSDPRLLAVGVRGMRIILAAFPVVGFQVVSSNFFQAIGKARTAMLLNMLRQMILLIPLVMLLPLVLKIDGVWLAGPVADITAAAITAVAIRREVNRLNRWHRQEIGIPEPEGLGPDSRHW